MKTTILVYLEETYDGPLVAFPLCPRFQKWNEPRAALADLLGLNPIGKPGVEVGPDLDVFRSRLIAVAKRQRSTVVELGPTTFRVTRDDCPEKTPVPRPLGSRGKTMRTIHGLRARVDRALTKVFLPANRRPLTVADLFDHAPEGAFQWDTEPEDVGNPWCCGDDDCESQWHLSVQWIDQGRDEQGRTWFIVSEDNFAGDGDYQPVAGWDERRGDTPTPDVLADLWHHFDGRVASHFAGWAKYNLDVAETGEDPLGSFYPSSGSIRERALRGAREHLRYLEGIASESPS